MNKILIIGGLILVGVLLVVLLPLSYNLGFKDCQAELCNRCPVVKEYVSSDCVCNYQDCPEVDCVKELKSAWDQADSEKSYLGVEE